MARFRRFRKKRPTQWVVSNSGYGQTHTTTAGPINSIELAGSTSVAGSFDPPVIERFTALMVIGDICIELAQAEPFASCLSIGFIVLELDEVGTVDPSALQWAARDWLMLKHIDIPENPTGQAESSLFTDVNKFLHPDVLIRNKRVIRANQGLYLVYRWHGLSQNPAAEDTFSVTPYLRVLMTKTP